jgi:hypothetical protein
LVEHADPHPVQAMKLEKVGVAVGNMTDTRRGLRVVGIIAHCRVKYDRDVSHAPPNRPTDIKR